MRVVIFATASTGDEAEVRGDHLGGGGWSSPGASSRYNAHVLRSRRSASVTTVLRACANTGFITHSSSCAYPSAACASR